ncbi:ABC transporter ATP-binding protein [Ectobacillus ponti]|uniref:ABC transporter ATP-binding protein n=1 Tax=Ectobacillus ponti TaxID=2961894 RepID=A0AA41X8Y2_9BACI|nr:ABC transporter ATP-binding protein [Ectobacillus ponti]MCP8968550.1 ABC transporter ATP-binding protein [Ectobacillus ponti]
MTLVQMEQVTKRYGKKEAVRDFSLALTEGKIIGLVGSNGSGKTTWMKLLAGQIYPTGGSIAIEGIPVGRATKSMVAYLPDGPFLDKWMNVAQALSFYEKFFDFDRQAAEEMLENLGIPQQSKVTALSKGTLEKLNLVLTLARRAKLYLLDEPLGGVDPVAREQILDLILSQYREDSTIVISTHLISEIERIFEEVIVVKDGALVLHQNVEDIRLQKGQAVNELFREVFQ